jgi:hypothetical protein
VPGRDLEAAHPEHEGAREVDRQREDPDHRLSGAAHERGGDQHQRGGQCRACEAHDRLARVDVVVRLGEDEDVEPARRGVGDREQQCVVSEGLGRRERRHEERAHHGEHEQPLEALVRGDVVGEPGVGAPGPPQRGQHQQALPEPLPGRVVRHEQGDLGQREDEDQVEEELERRYALLGAVRPRLGVVHCA